MNYVRYLQRFGNNTLPESIITESTHIVNRKLLRHLKHRLCSCSSAANELPEIDEADEFWKKIIYNEVLNKIIVKKKPRSESYSRPIFLKFLNNEDSKLDKTPVEKNEEKSELPNFPYEIKKQFLKEVEENNELDKTFPKSIYNFTPSDTEKIPALKWGSNTLKVDAKNIEDPDRWAFNSDDEGLESSNEVFKFGSYNPNQRVSTVPCGGCGAFLHCNNPSLPGFIPAEIFENKTKEELKAEICQRCLFLKEFDVSLGVNVSPSEYLKILSTIKEKDALAILMVDLLDFPCSIFPGILDIIGDKKPVVIVGNKVDMLIQEGPNCVYYFKKALLEELKKQGINLKNVQHVSLISAKTGYGVENLIDQLHLNWGCKGDVYLIGCTNVGKSTLFNTLIQSDYCKVKAINILQRATVSAWPGTTLNLLKFPIMKATRSRLVARSIRLKHQKKEENAAQIFQWMGQNIKLEQIPLQEHVGKTFFKESEAQTSMAENDSLTEEKREGLDPKDINFIRGKWFYDTPGVVREDQIVNLLTTSELLLTVPQKMLLPRNFRMRPGHSLFIGGLGRLDFISGIDNVWFTVFASVELPITVTKLKDADDVYNKLLGTPFFRVPMKGQERLAKWPGLSSKKFEIVGKPEEFDLKDKSLNQTGRKVAAADVVLSSAGWIAVTLPVAYRCYVEAWTPEGKGIYIRDCPIIRKGFTFRGNAIPKTPAFQSIVKEVKGFSVTDEPPL